MEVKNSTNIAALYLFLIVCSAQECQSYTVCAQRRLYYIRNVFFLCLIVKIGHILAGNVLMLGQVVVGSVCNPPQLAPSERE